MARSDSLIENSSDLQDAPKCRTESCGAIILLALSALLLALGISCVSAVPWAYLPELGHRRYFYEVEPLGFGLENDAQFCHGYGVDYNNAASGRWLAIRTQEECAFAAKSLGLHYSDASKPPCVNGCCINGSAMALMFNDSDGIYPTPGDFPAVCISPSANPYKLAAIAVAVTAGVTSAGCLMFVVLVLRFDNVILRAANAFVQSSPGDIFTLEISFGALRRQQEAANSGSLSACRAILAVGVASLAGMSVGSFVIAVVVPLHVWTSWETTLAYVLAFGFMVGVGVGLFLGCVRLAEKMYGETARACSLSYMQMHFFFVPSGLGGSLVRQEPSVCIIQGDRCHVLRSIGREPTATLEDRGLTICSSELVKESDRHLENSSSLAFADWSLKVGYAKVRANNIFNQIMSLDRGFLHFYFEGDSEASRLHEWLQATPAFRYRGCQSDFDRGACRIITLKQDADASIVGRLLSGAQALEVDSRQDELAGSLRYRLADAMRVHPSRLSLFRRGGTLHDRLDVGDLDSVVVCERIDSSAAEAAPA